MRWYLSGEKADPWVAAHFLQVLFAPSSTLQFYSVDLLKVRIFVSSTNPRGKIFPLLSSVRRLEAKKRYRIGDSEEPCGIPVGVEIAWLVCPLKRSYIDLLLRKE